MDAIYILIVFIAGLVAGFLLTLFSVSFTIRKVAPIIGEIFKQLVVVDTEQQEEKRT